MCGSSYGPPRRPVFVHVIRPVASDMPELTPFSGEEIECAFPNLFELLTVSMFLDPRGYQGETDEEQKTSSGSYYALSWGCIHRDTLSVWRPYSRNVRRHFWTSLWNWVWTLGKEPLIPPGMGPYYALAFFDPLPIPLFERAVFRLVRKGFLDHQTEEHEPSGQTISVYHPTPALAERLRSAELSRST